MQVFISNSIKNETKLKSDILLKLNDFFDVYEIFVEGFLIQQLKNENTQTPDVDFPAVFVPINILKPESVEVFVFFFEPNLWSEVHYEVEDLWGSVYGVAHGLE